jgi:hypothetical protein
MRPRGPTLKVSDFPEFNSSNPNPAIRFALYAKRNGAQTIGTLWRDERPAQLPDRQFHAHAPGKSGTAGRTNGMPWDGTSPINESTHVEIVPAKKPVKGFEARVLHASRMPNPRNRVDSFMGICAEVGTYSLELADMLLELAESALRECPK